MHVISTTPAFDVTEYNLAQGALQEFSETPADNPFEGRFTERIVPAGEAQRLAIDLA